MESTLSRRSRMISALALYPARIKTSAGISMAAFISKRIAPLSSTPLGETYSSFAGIFLSWMAPMVISIGIFTDSFPTSVSSIFPTKSISLRLATDAMVVPSLKLLDCITEFPTFTGTSRIVPLTVARTRVLLYLAELLVIPVRTRLRLSVAARSSSWSFLYWSCTFSNSSFEITWFSYSFRSRS